MAKIKISEYSATASANTDINNINIDEGCAPSNINNAIRELMAQIKNLQAGTSGDTIPVLAGGTGAANATTARSNLSAAASGSNSDITALNSVTTPLTLIQGGTGTTKAFISGVARSTNVATITTASAHGFTTGDKITVSGVTTANFNSANVTVASTPSSTTFTYANGTSFGDVAFTADATGSAVSLTSIRSNFGLVIGTDIAGLATVESFTKAQRITPVALTSTSASIAVDASLSNNFTHTFTENTTLANPTNLVAGQGGTIVFTQHASLPKTLAFGSYWKFQDGSVPSVTAISSSVDVLVYYVESSSRISAKLITDVQ